MIPTASPVKSIVRGAIQYSLASACLLFMVLFASSKHAGRDGSFTLSKHHHPRATRVPLLLLRSLPMGKKIATGSYDGTAKVWGRYYR